MILLKAATAIICIIAFSSSVTTIYGIPLPGGLPVQPITEVITTFAPSPNNNNGGDQPNSDSAPNVHSYNPSQESGDAHLQEASESCLGAEKELVQPAIRSVDAVISKFDSVFEPLNKTAYLVWGKCKESFGLLDTIYTDVHIECMPSPLIKPNTCSGYQRSINRSIPYLRCYSEFIGHILTNITESQVYNTELYQSHSDAYSHVREGVYEAYENVTGVLDAAKVVDLFPCQSEEEQNDDSFECVTYEDTSCTPEYRSCLGSGPDCLPRLKCLDDSVSGDTVFLKQMIVISRMAYIMSGLSAQLDRYKMNCLEREAE